MDSKEFEALGTPSGLGFDSMGPPGGNTPYPPPGGNSNNYPPPGGNSNNYPPPGGNSSNYPPPGGNSGSSGGGGGMGYPPPSHVNIFFVLLFGCSFLLFLHLQLPFIYIHFNLSSKVNMVVYEVMCHVSF